MITDAQSIKQLQFRSDLPRLHKEGLFLFAQLESEEQKLPENKRTKLILEAYAQLLKDPSSAMLFDHQLTSAVPLAYQVLPDNDPQFEQIECLVRIEGDHNSLTRGKLKVFLKTFVYFCADDMRSIPEAEVPAGWVPYS